MAKQQTPETRQSHLLSTEENQQVVRFFLRLNNANGETYLLSRDKPYLVPLFPPAPLRDGIKLVDISGDVGFKIDYRRVYNDPSRSETTYIYYSTSSIQAVYRANPRAGDFLERDYLPLTYQDHEDIKVLERYANVDLALQRDVLSFGRRPFCGIIPKFMAALLYLHQTTYDQEAVYLLYYAGYADRQTLTQLSTQAQEVTDDQLWLSLMRDANMDNARKYIELLEQVVLTLNTIHLDRTARERFEQYLATFTWDPFTKLERSDYATQIGLDQRLYDYCAEYYRAIVPHFRKLVEIAEDAAWNG